MGISYLFLRGVPPMLFLYALSPNLSSPPVFPLRSLTKVPLADSFPFSSALPFFQPSPRKAHIFLLRVVFPPPNTKFPFASCDFCWHPQSLVFTCSHFFLQFVPRFSPTFEELFHKQSSLNRDRGSIGAHFTCIRRWNTLFFFLISLIPLIWVKEPYFPFYPQLPVSSVPFATGPQFLPLLAFWFSNQVSPLSRHSMTV